MKSAIKYLSFAPLLASKMFILVFALLAIVFGLRLSHASNTLEVFVGAFLVISGAQVSLWVFGIRLEMFGNTAAGVVSSAYEKIDKEIITSDTSDEGNLHLLEGRMLSMLGYVLGETSIDSGNPLAVLDRDRLLKAVSLCERGYKVLKGVGGTSEFMALNNLVFYSCALDEEVRREFLLRQAKHLLNVGQEHNSLNLMLTSCYAILKLSDDQRERDYAMHTLHAIQHYDRATEREKEEAALYKVHFSKSDQQRNAPSKRPQADG